MTDIFFKRLCSRESLFSAWRHVRANAFRSPSQEIRAAAIDFDSRAFREIQSIQSRLTAKTFVFPPATGVLKDKTKREKQGKDPRPLVISDIKSRIVQRALLECLQPNDNFLSGRIGKIAAVNESTVNFGCTPNGGVPRAINQVITHIDDGNCFYFKSDIGSFFTKIPRKEVLAFIRAQIGDEQFLKVFEQGLNLQLENGGELGEYLRLFPNNEIGVAQGSSLSAFAGNIFLLGVDQKFANASGAKLVRYVDDVLLLAKSNDILHKEASALRYELKRLGLTLYDPSNAPDKAAIGHIRDGFDYLGCTIRGRHIEPSKSAKFSLLKKVDKKIEEAKININRFMSNPALKRTREVTFVRSITEIDEVIRGWGNSFRFVTNRLAFVHLDKKISEKISEFESWLRKIKYSSVSQQFRVLGVSQIADVEHRPISNFASAKNAEKQSPKVDKAA